MGIFRELSATQKRSLEFIKKELADGAKVPVGELQQKARKARIPIRSLTFSRKLLGIVVSGGRAGNSFWSLPE